MMRKVVVITAILVSLGIGFSTNERASGTMPSYERVDPPIVWDVDLPEGEYQVGDVVTARINFYFYEMPEHGQWDPVWQARFYLYKPRGLDRYASELTPISVGTRESYEASFEITQPGAYVLEACVNAVTAPKDWPQPSGRGSIFSYKSGKKGSRFSASSGTAPDTGWQPIKGTSAMIRRFDPYEPQALDIPGKKAALERGQGGVEAMQGREKAELSMVYRNYEIRPYYVEPLNSIVLGHTKTQPNEIRVIEFTGIAAIDSFRLTDENLGEVTKLNKTTLKLIAASESIESRLTVFFGDRRAHVFFNAPRQGWSVTGVFEFQSATGQMLPAAQMLVETWWVDGLGYWTLIDDGYTDNTGYISLFGYGDTTHLLLTATSPNSDVWYCENHACADADYVYLHLHGLTITNPAHEDVSVEPPFSQVTAPSVSGAFNIAREMIVAEDNLLWTVNPYPLPDPLPVIWDSACGEDYSASYGGYLVGGAKAIFLRGWSSPDSNRDEMDPAVINHEYSHYIMDWYADIDPYSGGEHGYTSPAHFPGSDQWKNFLLAYSEGWANFFQGVLRGDKGLADLSTPYDSAWWVEFERPNPDVPYYLWMDQQQPSNSRPYFEAAQVEGAVTEALWDLFDYVNDGDFYQGGDLYGHNDDYNGSEYWAGIDYIWDVFWDFDPRPDDPEIDFCRTIYDFIHGWRSWSYPVEGKFRDIFESHGIAVFIPGDANGDGLANITDITYIIQYIFNSGPLPRPVLASGDMDGDCLISITDGVYMINYIFAGGPAPVPGCAPDDPANYP